MPFSQKIIVKSIGLRVRMTLLMLMAVIPFISLLIAGRVHMYRERTDNIFNEATFLALKIAGHPQRIVPDPHAFLSNLSSLPEMQHAEEDCSSLLELFDSTLRTHPYFPALAVFHPDGNRICSATSKTNPVNLMDRDYFRRVLQEQQYTISHVLVGRISKNKSIVFANPVFDAHGKLKYVVILSLDADWLKKYLIDATSEIKSSSRIIAMAIDDAGTNITTSPGFYGHVDAEIPGWEDLAPRLQRSRTFARDEIWLDGVRRATAYVPLFSSSSGTVRLRVGVPTEPALALVHQNNLEQLGVGAIFVLAVLGFAWLASEKLIVRPLNRMRAVATALKDGDFSARVPGAHQSGELGELARTFNSMASQMQNDRDILSVLATHDQLTGLMNRYCIHSELQKSILAAEESRCSVSVILLDLNGFKEINDSLGHPVGDKILVQVAKTLNAAAAGHGKLGRLGGDEFVVIVDNTLHEASPDKVARDIIHSLKKPLTVDGQQFFLSASVGIATFPVHGRDVDALLQNADIAMYKAKAEKLQIPIVYSVEMNACVAGRLKMQNLLSQAVARNELELHYQPKVSAISGRMTGAEALVRWRHPELGLVSPNEFIPLAEKTGLIVEIGEWVLSQACLQLMAWQPELSPDFTMAVNVSPRQFSDPELTTKFHDILVRTGVRAHRVELEITEGALMHNPTQAIEALQALRAMGAKVSIDDFGTGYSSLSYLKHLPVDALKIDRSFVSGLPGNKSDHTLVSAVVSIATDLGLRVTAEGVETEAQVDALRSIGCGEMQGYYFDRPLIARDFLEVIKRDASERSV